MLSNLRKTHDAARVAQRLIQVIGEPVRLAARSLVVTPSVGIAIYPKDGSDAETLLHSADSAMYFAKRNGPGTFSFFDPRMSAREHAHSAPPNVQQDAVR